MAMVERRARPRRGSHRLALAALADGSLTEATLFDDRYIEVPGTNPQLFRNRFSDWADAKWRPVLDQVKASDPHIIATRVRRPQRLPADAPDASARASRPATTRTTCSTAATAG